MSLKLTLVVGGVSSGKSRWAEQQVELTSLNPVYIATAQSIDAEMAKKISAHRKRRGSAWKTVECPLALSAALKSLKDGEVALVECMSTWLTNHMRAGSHPQQVCDDLVSVLNELNGQVVIVTSEAGCGIVPDNAMAREFGRRLGELNQQLAALAQDVVLVVAGFPVVLRDGTNR